jgi:hypothetical protein
MTAGDHIRSEIRGWAGKPKKLAGSRDQLAGARVFSLLA